MVRRSLLFVSLALIPAIFLSAKTKYDPKYAYLRQLLNAGTVAVVAYPQGTQIGPGKAEDMYIVSEVERRIRSWKRFAVISTPENADFVIGVRVGAATDVFAGGGGSVGTNPPPPHTTIGGELGPDQDMLVVVRGQTKQPFDNPPLWQVVRERSLSMPALAAVNELKKDLEEAERQKKEDEKKK